MFAELDKLNKEMKSIKLLCVHTNGTEYNFNDFTKPGQFSYDITLGSITIKQTKDEQNKMSELIASLVKYKPTNTFKINRRPEVLKNAKNNFDGRKTIIEAFEDGTVPLPKKVLDKNKSEGEEKKEKEKRKADLKENRKADSKNFYEEIKEIETGGIDRALFEKHFS